jgi:undecaprenyl-diphosphatase
MHAVGRAPGRVDESVEQATARVRNQQTLLAAKAAGRLGDGGVVWLVLLWWLGRSQPRRVVRAVGVLAAGAVLVNVPVKRAFDRERPEPLEEGQRRPYGSSFPSGHAFASWLVLGLLPVGRVGRVLAGALAGVISASRVLERHHHATDVLAGAAMGAVTGASLRRLVGWER